MPRRLKVLVSAYACEPDRGSEPGVGWNQVLQIARFHDVWVITRANNERAIAGATGLPSSIHWVFYDLPRWLGFWKKGQRGVHLYYYLWQAGVYRFAKRLLRRRSFDIVHHVTFVNYWMPSILSLLPVPFIWGPLGGGESVPRGFWSTFSTPGKLVELARSTARWLGEHDPLVRATARNTSLAFATTCDTATRLARIGCRRVLLLGESGIAEKELNHLSTITRRANGDLRLASIGRLVPFKGHHLGLQAFAGLKNAFPGSSYQFIGGGPERARLGALARSLGVSDSVLFRESLPRALILEALAGFDVLIHPSLHDSGGWVCLEAMASGCPVICLDLGGPATQVSDKAGIRVAAVNPEQAVEGLTAAMKLLASDPELRRRMGNAARALVVRRFAWNRKGEAMRELYDLVDTCEGSGHK
jgi:glycosyltransferase involved in cell wall biosynthesis